MSQYIKRNAIIISTPLLALPTGWSNVWKASRQHDKLQHAIKHFAYAGGWKKFEPLWNFLIKTKGLNKMLPLLEAILSTVNPDNRKTGQPPFPAIA